MATVTVQSTSQGRRVFCGSFLNFNATYEEFTAWDSNQAY